MHVNNLVTFLSVQVNIMAFDITLYVLFSVNMNLCSFLSTAKDSIWSVDNCLKLDTDTFTHEWTKMRSFLSSVAYMCVFYRHSWQSGYKLLTIWNTLTLVLSQPVLKALMYQPCPSVYWEIHLCYRSVFIHYIVV